MKGSNFNNEFNEYNRFDDLNNDFFQNSLLKSRSRNPFFYNKETSQKKEGYSNLIFEKCENSRTKLKKISTNFNEVFSNSRNQNQNLNPFNFDIVRTSNIFGNSKERNNLKENKGIKYADDYKIQKKNFLNVDSAKKSIRDNSKKEKEFEREREKEQKYSEINSDKVFSFKFPENKSKGNTEKYNINSSFLRNNS